MNAVLTVCKTQTRLEIVPDPSFLPTLVPYLKPEEAANYIGRAHSIDVSKFDIDRVARFTEENSSPGHEKKPAEVRAAEKLSNSNLPTK